ncbi:hypothetical protein C8F04DRAFT_1395014 [Mycena alexandri]|uniref:BAG domain-containing protein n=1 Tax=Mycena alexandri TaxID=1745969 RepID=A0AAD6SVP5_9AGAR|nr:hypothetical protein C8F04DRAFT_1395014 [Mycena alexandri]
MFAQSYYPSAYVPPYSHQHATTSSSSPRARYVSAISRVQEAEMEYRAYLAQQEQERELQRERERIGEQERVRYLLAQQERIRQQRVEEERVRVQLHLRQLQLQEQRRRRAEEAQAVKLLVHAAVASLLSAEAPQPRPQRQLAADPSSILPTQNLEAQTGAQLQRRNRVRVVRPAPPAQARESPRPVDVESVRTALKRRLTSEPNVEVHATIHRLLANLPSASAPGPKTKTNPVAAPGKANTEPEAKATPASEIQKIERAFRALASEFVFPAQLDFSFTTLAAEPESPSPSPAPTLAYTPHNAPLRQYEHALNALLARLDAVESLGDEGVRAERRRVVGLVEGALEGVGRVVEGRWKLVDVGGRKTSVVKNGDSAEGSNATTTQTPATEEQPQVAPAPSAPSVETTPEAAPVASSDSAAPPTSTSIPAATFDSETTQTRTASVPVEAQVASEPSQTLAVLPAVETNTPQEEASRQPEAELESPQLPSVVGDDEEEPASSASQGAGADADQDPAVVLDTPTAVPAVEESESLTPAEDPADVPASSPKSLSLSIVVPLPAEELVAESDSESNYSDSDSVGSWSEVEGA